MKIYFISGLGANGKTFEKLSLPQGFESIYLEWLIPEKNETLPHYAMRMAEKINPNEPFVLVGLSFGGIVAQEIQQQIQPEKLVLISTIKSREEYPKYIKLAKTIPLHKIFPMQFISYDGFLSYAMFRKMYDRRMPKLNEFFTHKNHHYLRWSIHQIIHWQPPVIQVDYCHIHGTKDIVFPSKNIQNSQLISGGTHIMILQRAKAVSEKINQFLMEEN